MNIHEKPENKWEWVGELVAAFCIVSLPFILLLILPAFLN